MNNFEGRSLVATGTVSYGPPWWMRGIVESCRGDMNCIAQDYTISRIMFNITLVCLFFFLVTRALR